ncbi:Uncharacterized protein APZ42_008470, partial [Daphnia magna]
AKFPEDISQRKVLLMYPIMSEYLNINGIPTEQFDLNLSTPRMCP